MPRLARDLFVVSMALVGSALFGVAVDFSTPTRVYGFAFTTAEQVCRDTVASSTVKLATVAAKTLVGCHKSRDRGSVPAATDCNDTVVADDGGATTKVAAALATRSASRCGALDPASVGYVVCPSPCSSVGGLDDFVDVSACIDCLARDGTELLSGTCQASPMPPLAGAERACHDDIGRAWYKYFRTVLKERRRCQRLAESGGASDTDVCASGDPRGKIAKVATIAERLIERSCDDADLDALGACSTASAAALADCVLASSQQQATAIFLAMYDLGGNVTTTTTTTLPPQDSLCPETVELVLHGRVGEICATSADCFVGTCDAALGRCLTATDLDTGWTGVSHNADISDAAIVRARLRCPGPFDSQAAEPCGECLVIGVDPSARSCRCANDNRSICDEPFRPDADDCSGATCNCYLGPPLSLSSGNTPVCVVNRLREDIRGTASVDVGASASQVRLGSVVYLGEGLTEPCPYCAGDPTPGDGVRGGTCVLGKDADADCDTDAVNRTFPAPGGDGHSLDCFPSSGKNVTGTGLKIAFDQTTGAAEPISATIPCFFNSFLCHCMVCTGDTTLACDSNAVCAAAGAGTCTTFANGANTKPNGCTGDFLCADQGDGEGRCNQGPDSSFCDGVTTAEGHGFVACNSNADCASSSCGSVSCGQCTILERRPCFLDTIEATGTPSPGQPTTVGTFCIPPTSNAGVNAVAGLPGPGRLANAQRSTLYCSSNPSVVYTPGSGGCP